MTAPAPPPARPLPAGAAAALERATAAFSAQLQVAGRNVLTVRRPGRPDLPPAEVDVEYAVRDGVAYARPARGARTPRWADGLRFPLLRAEAVGDGRTLRVSGRFPLPSGVYADECPTEGEACETFLHEAFADLLRRPLAELARP